MSCLLPTFLPSVRPRGSGHQSCWPLTHDRSTALIVLGTRTSETSAKWSLKKPSTLPLLPLRPLSYWGYNPKKFGHRRFLPSQLHFHPAQPCVGTMERGSLQKCMGGGDIYIYYFSFLFWCSVWTSVSHPHLMSWTLCMNSWQVIKYTISVCVWMCDSVTELLTGSIYAQLLLLRFHVIPIP